MGRFIEDKDGDHILVLAESDEDMNGVTLAATQTDRGGDEPEVMRTTVGPLDPRALIEAIKAECELHEDDEVHDEEPKASPVDTFTITGKAINTGRLSVRFEDSEPLRAMEPDEEPQARETYVHTTPATAEEPRVWAGADEPIIDSLIGRVADLEDEKERTEAHEHLAEHWNRRLEVVRSALGMLPAPGKRGGMLAAFAGEETPDPLRVENALKIARFAADEDRDIPGVDS